MTLPETDVARVLHWVDSRNAEIPERANDPILYELDVDPWAITILECRHHRGERASGRSYAFPDRSPAVHEGRAASGRSTGATGT